MSEAQETPDLDGQRDNRPKAGRFEQVSDALEQVSDRLEQKLGQGLDRIED